MADKSLLLDEQLLDEQLLDEQLPDEQSPDEQFLDEQLLDELLLDEQLLDEQLTALLPGGPAAASAVARGTKRVEFVPPSAKARLSKACGEESGLCTRFDL